MRMKIIAVDCDGTLCNEVCFTPRDCLTSTPIKKNIRKVNELYQDNFIVIYTARRSLLISATLMWLEKHDVKFHAISNRKIPFDIYINSGGGE